MGLYEDIKEFHEKFELIYDGQPRALPTDLYDFRAKFMTEELTEYMTAYLEGRLADQLDSLVDLVYVVLGTAYLQGFDFNEAWRRVHEANMRKVRALKADDSKRGSTYDVVKPEDWLKPDLSDLVAPRN